jgi:hypothetical protein
MLIDELVFGSKGETEVIIAGASEEAATKPLRNSRKIEVSSKRNPELGVENPRVI